VMQRTTSLAPTQQDNAGWRSLELHFLIEAYHVAV
jgi:hypothetical protein